MVCGAPIGHEIPSWLAIMVMSTIHVVFHEFAEMPADTIQSEFVYGIDEKLGSSPAHCCQMHIAARRNEVRGRRGSALANSCWEWWAELRSKMFL